MVQQSTQSFQFEAALQTERARLVRLCARLSGDQNSAEDLAQETLIEAWRQRQRLHDPSGHARWLSAIARNVCLRWARRHGRELAHLAHTLSSRESNQPAAVEQLPDSLNLEVELERAELVRLLDRALALLPDETRIALVARYIDETPVAEVAARLGLAEGAVAVRLHRGRLALRRILETKLRDEASVYGLADALALTWRPTTIWCPHCGQHRLVVQASQAADPRFWTRCPDCHSVAGAYFVQVARTSPLTNSGFRRTLFSVVTETGDYFRRAFQSGAARCSRCGRPLPVATHISDGKHLSPGARIVGAWCDVCDAGCWTYHAEMVLYLPAGRRFWQRHKRIRALPEQEVELDGRAALVTSFEDVASTARLEVISARDSLKVLRVHEVIP
jgi:RNA polymerase sigma factor (sigma-70 family)